jgi:hypothetical protein
MMRRRISSSSAGIESISMRRREEASSIQVDGLVGQEAVRDVAVREHRRRHQGRVLDLDLVVDLVLLLEPAEDRDGVLHRGLAHQDRLEAALQRGVLLDVLAVLVERGGAHAAQLAAGQGRLQHVGRVHRALRRARPHQGVQLVDEADDLARGLGDLAQHRLQAILELAAVLGSRHHGRDVHRDQALVLEPLRHVAGHDALREPFDDRGLAHAGLADQHRVVLGAPGEDLDYTTDFFVPSDDRVQLALAREVGQVLGVALQRLVLVLRVRVGHPLGAPHLDQGPIDRLRAHAGGGEQARGRAALLLGDGDEQMLGRDVLVLEPLRLLPRPVDHALEARGGILPPAAAPDLGQLVDLGLHLARDCLRPGPQLGEQRPHHALLLLQEREQQVLGLDRLVVALIREGLRGLDRFLGLDGQLVQPHLTCSPL